MTNGGPNSDDGGGPELLTVAEMARADRLTVDHGVPGVVLMEAAGTAVASVVRELAAERGLATPQIVIFCGPGNNGGDGFVAARLLADAGLSVVVNFLGDINKLPVDSKVNAERWREMVGGTIADFDLQLVNTADIIVDALFGAGLSRPLDGVALAGVKAIEAARTARGVAVIAVDMPSGIEGDTGHLAGAAAQADVTVTFFRRKPGHLLYPGRGRCGRVVVAEIGIAAEVLEEIAPTIFANGPHLWRERLPRPRAGDHKYARGAACIVGGAKLTGAARLAAHAALRAGAGLVSIASAPDAAPIYRASHAGVIVQEFDGADDFEDILSDRRFAALLIGPGGGVGALTADQVLAALQRNLGLVLDADALTSFADDPGRLFAAIKASQGPCVLTPHEGEFARLFGAVDPAASKCERVRGAAHLSGAVVLLKGPDTVIGAPDGRLAINENAPPALATAGSGDVLAGFIVALLAQRMDAFDAALAGTWLHGAAGASFGPGLIAEDLPDLLPEVLRGLGQKD